MRKNISDKIFEEVTLFLFMIDGFIKFKMVSSLPKFYGLLAVRIYCNWLTDRAFDHSSFW